MNNIFLLIISLVVFLVVVLGTVYLFTLFMPYSVEEMPIFVYVGDKVGIDVNTTAVTFGTLMPGDGAERTVKIYAPVKEQVFLRVEGIDFVSLDVEEVVLEADQTTNVAIYAKPPEGTKKGPYEGKLLLVTKKL
jgi:hypothetical protein